MYQPLYCHLKGVLPALQNNGQLKDPLNFWAKEIRRYSGKRTKTDDDHIAMMEAEFKGSLYVKDEKKGGPIIWPAENAHACFKTAAKLKKLGKIWDTAVIVEDPCRFIYEGPKTRDALWQDPNFRLVKATRRGVMSCRPKFDNWEVKLNLTFLPNVINSQDVQSIIREAGKYIGFSNWPRRYGLFEVVDFKEERVDVWNSK